MTKNLKKICFGGLFAALVVVSTISLQIPVPATTGYIHAGDSVILLISIFFGYKYGMFAGGVGSMLADIITGYTHWAPFTLIIKALMGFFAGKIAENEKIPFGIRSFLASLVAEIVMVGGYFLGGILLKGSALVALESVPANIIQGVGGMIICLVVGFGFKKAGIRKEFLKRNI